MLDISKAYDSVNHKALWSICEQLGVKGTWLENVKALYSDNTLQSITNYGMTPEVKMVRGIRQGCPLSPLLFAVYVEPITRRVREVLQNKGYMKDDEPVMKLYADDMAVWDTREEVFGEKLKAVVEGLEELGMLISEDKTELQHNEWQSPSREGNTIRIQTKGGEKRIKYLPTGKPIRYLGAWLTADAEDKEGEKRALQKVSNVLEVVAKSRANPINKARLLNILGVPKLNYTAATQVIDKWELEKMDNKIYHTVAGDTWNQKEAIGGSNKFFHGCVRTGV